MNKWALRIAGMLLILALILVLMQMQRTLVRMTQERGVTTTT